MREEFYPVLRGGGLQNVSDPQFFHLPPLPIINDQSLTVWRTMDGGGRESGGGQGRPYNRETMHSALNL